MHIKKNYYFTTSSQDGGVGRYTLLPHTTKRRTTNLKTKNKPETRKQTENRIVWKYNNQRVKEETFIQTGKRGGHWQSGWRRHMVRRQVAEQTVPHLRADKPGGTTADQDRPCNPGFQHGQNKDSEPLAVKSLWRLWWWEKLPVP